MCYLQLCEQEKHVLMELSSSIVCVYNQFSFESTIKYDKASKYLRAKIAVMDLYAIADFEIHKLGVTSIVSLSKGFACAKCAAAS